MKKSKLVAVGLAGAVAALMAGCATQTQTADCVDAQGRVVPDYYCQNSGTTYGYHPYYHWLYGGHIHSYGGYRTVSGGSTTPMSGADITSRSGMSISRGGFGGAGDAHGGFGRGGGG